MNMCDEYEERERTYDFIRTMNILHQVRDASGERQSMVLMIISQFSANSEAEALELVENLKEMFSRY